MYQGSPPDQVLLQCNNNIKGDLDALSQFQSHQIIEFLQRPFCDHWDSGNYQFGIVSRCCMAWTNHLLDFQFHFGKVFLAWKGRVRNGERKTSREWGRNECVWGSGQLAHPLPLEYTYDHNSTINQTNWTLPVSERTHYICIQNKNVQDNNLTISIVCSILILKINGINFEGQFLDEHWWLASEVNSVLIAVSLLSRAILFVGNFQKVITYYVNISVFLLENFQFKISYDDFSKETIFFHAYP